MAWFNRLLNALHGERLSSDIDRELAFHITEKTDELKARGFSDEAALHEARRRFGNYTNQKEQTRAVNLHGWLDTLMADLRYAFRALRKSPTFAFVAIASLALGIGANTAIFSLLDAVILKSLPVRAPNELLRVVEKGSDFGVFTNPLWEELRNRQDVFSHAFAYGSAEFNLAKGGETDPVSGAFVSGDFFNTLGVAPAAGRLLTIADDRRGCAPVAVLSHAFWRRRFAGDPAIAGKLISLNGKDFQVIGVSAPSFPGVEVGSAMDVYAPICAQAVIAESEVQLDARSTWWLRVIGRIKPGLTSEQVGARLAQMSPVVFGATIPTIGGARNRAEYAKRTFDVKPGGAGYSMLRREYSRGLVALMIVVATVLLIACANVANLLLARATARQREIAVRLAIGAGRARIVRQLLTESLLLSLLGASVGVAFAVWGNRLLVTLLSTRGNPIWLDLGVNIRVLGFAIGTALFTGCLFGLAPAWRSTRIDPHAIIKANARSIVRGDSRFGLAKALVAVQIALSLVLVVAATLLLGTFRRLATLDRGFRAEPVLLASVNLRDTEMKPEERKVVFTTLLEQARALPGVIATAMSDITPLSGASWNEMIVVDGFTPKSDMDAIAWMNQVSAGYFAALGTRLLQGRDFDAQDTPGSMPVAIITETFARHFFGDRNPIGKTYRTDMGDQKSAPVEIIGVVQDVKYNSLREARESIAYVASSQRVGAPNSQAFAITIDGNPRSIMPVFADLVKQVHPRASIRFTRLTEQVGESITRERLLATLSGFFGALALLLAIIGLYGVISYTMARRRNEIGIRIALGSARNRILRLVLSEVAQIVGLGLAVGTGLVLASTRLIAALLYGVTPSDVRTIVGSAALLATAALLAGLLPAVRAARLDPMLALRDE